MLIGTWSATDKLLATEVADAVTRCRLTMQIEKLFDEATLAAYEHGCEVGRYRLTRTDAARILNGNRPQLVR
jgi:hypothetical protein